MGGARFSNQYGVEESLAKECVAMYRETFPRIPKLWYAMEDAVKLAMQTGNTISIAKVKWKTTKDFLQCELPSGRKISYFQPRLEQVDTPWGEKKLTLVFTGKALNASAVERKKAYGGLLVENITQAIARDIQADSMVRLDERGYPVVIHAHDEIVSQVAEDFGSVEEFETIMSELEPWAGGIPIKAEGWEGKRYKK